MNVWMNEWMNERTKKIRNNYEINLTPYRRPVKKAEIGRAIKVKQSAKRDINAAVFVGLQVSKNFFHAIPPIIKSAHFNATSVRRSSLERTPVSRPLRGVTTYLCHPKSNVSYEMPAAIREVLGAPRPETHSGPRRPPVPKESSVPPCLPHRTRARHTPVSTY